MWKYLPYRPHGLHDFWFSEESYPSLHSLLVQDYRSLAIEMLASTKLRTSLTNLRPKRSDKLRGCRSWFGRLNRTTASSCSCNEVRGLPAAIKERKRVDLIVAKGSSECRSKLRAHPAPGPRVDEDHEG
jgi:hypothetical protein